MSLAIQYYKSAFAKSPTQCQCDYVLTLEMSGKASNRNAADEINDDDDDDDDDDCLTLY